MSEWTPERIEAVERALSDFEQGANANEGHVIALARIGLAVVKADPEAVERVARVLDPGRWAVMDGYLQDTIRKHRGQDVGWPADQFKDAPSMAAATAALAALREMADSTPSP